MRVKIWGSRGTRPVFGGEFESYGGETSCIEARADNGDALILDAGSGLGSLERAWKANPSLRPRQKVAVMLSHGHLDHVQGLPFSASFHNGDFAIYTPKAQAWQERLFDGQLFPVKWHDLAARIEVRELEPGAKLRIGAFEVEAMPTNHPGGNLAYKVSADGWSFVYTGDHEIPLENADPESRKIHEKLIEFMSGAEVALVDASYSEQDLMPGWGHSFFEQWPKVLANHGVNQIIFTHLNPDYSDAKIDDLVWKAQAKFPGQAMCAGRPGLEIDRNGIIAGGQSGRACEICSFFQSAADLTDTHAVLDAILTEARRICNADAGTVYLRKGDKLEFSAAHNDTLFPASQANKYAYMNSRIPLDRSSIAGYVASTGVALNLPDAYSLPPDCEFGFNADFDEKTGYRSQSMLVVPVVNSHRSIIGVLQLINSRDAENKMAAFTAGMQERVSRLAAMATIPLERSFLITSMILRMLSTSALRDPFETGQHVRRVGAMAAELYQRWAEAHGVDADALLATKSKLRLAAMLHDVGKVGIPDAILKKPGRLDTAERTIMEQHAALGAKLFSGEGSEIDEMARDIVLHHHARWDGTGYTGSESIASPGHGDIPLWARITAIADVYDALASKRCYKDAWEPERAMKILKEEAGSHFDPELVRYFEEIQDLVHTIYQTYGESKEDGEK